MLIRAISWLLKYAEMKLLFKEEVYLLIGYAIEVWKTLGFGFSEVIYKDALEAEFLENAVPYKRESQMAVQYKGKILQHRFIADFILFDEIIIEVKSGDNSINDSTIAQTLNYMKASGCRVGLITNFGKTKMDFKRLVL